MEIRIRVISRRYSSSKASTGNKGKYTLWDKEMNNSGTSTADNCRTDNNWRKRYSDNTTNPSIKIPATKR